MACIAQTGARNNDLCPDRALRVGLGLGLLGSGGSILSVPVLV
jgi:hypothetical protein